jgi:hypothetical protein
VEFLHRLTTIVDDLRNIDRPLRGEALAAELERLNQRPEGLGWDPTAAAGEPSYRIVRIVVEECKVNAGLTGDRARGCASGVWR